MTHVKRMLISADPQEVRVAIVEGGKLSEAYIERRGRRSIVGNIYKGRVDAVLPGMEAAFVDIGLPKNGFLYVAEIVLPELDDRERRSKRIQELIQSGQDVLVQVTKDPMGSKGARLTMDVSLAGRFMVLAPGGDGVGVSKKLEGPERDRLRDLLRKMKTHEDAGLIARTAAQGASLDELERDVRLLEKLWSRQPRPRPARRGARARLRRARPLAADGARRLPRRRGRARDRRRAPVPPHPRLRAAHLARARRARQALQGQAPALPALRDRAGHPLHALPPRAAALRRLARVRLRRGVHRRRRQHGALHRHDQEARGHDPQEQPRGRGRGRPPAAPARHRRHHRRRLHRHGEPEEPRRRARGAAARAQEGPQQGLRRRDLAARPGRDDAQERRRRRARDHDLRVPEPARAPGACSPTSRSRSTCCATCAASRASPRARPSGSSSRTASRAR